MATFVLVHGTGCGGWVWQVNKLKTGHRAMLNSPHQLAKILFQALEREGLYVTYPHL
jgi:hypothetical protein